MGNLTEFVVVGRHVPTEAEPSPKLYRMRIFAPNNLVAKSRYWQYMKKLQRIKKSVGEILHVGEVPEKNPNVVKNFGIWIRYDSRSGTHNMYKEYRELSRADAVSACYMDLAGRHRARARSIQIIRIQEVEKSEDLRRAYVQQFLNSKIKFPLPQRRVRATSKSFKTVLKANLPSISA
ncbi:50S ribosomal protein L18Ae [Fonticula alba]|uniref:60S ribosomal protein L18a n=1 Tax=Fonticula alba TaxID=691883 RepID=A0A058ZFG5_FONAL|nr:50S ribosomal protein L18Ae [Fonticula alba]KCV72673.1 50S ribosomal protein L18Ae [Fonticula alba]|eukprot:XP_009492374.1 50S ribosomal protein L18Ae [Fonticula alba]